MSDKEADGCRHDDISQPNKVIPDSEFIEELLEIGADTPDPPVKTDDLGIRQILRLNQLGLNK